MLRWLSCRRRDLSSRVQGIVAPPISNSSLNLKELCTTTNDPQHLALHSSFRFAVVTQLLHPKFIRRARCTNSKLSSCFPARILSAQHYELVRLAGHALHELLTISLLTSKHCQHTNPGNHQVIQTIATTLRSIFFFFLYLKATSKHLRSPLGTAVWEL